MTKKLIRDVLGSPIPQYYNEGSGFYVANTNGTGDATGVDFSKKKLIRDVLGSVIPQYYDVAEGKFKPVTSEVFTQVSSGKSLLETAINEKGSTVDKVGDVATFEELRTAILTISVDGSGGEVESKPYPEHRALTQGKNFICLQRLDDGFILLIFEKTLFGLGFFLNITNDVRYPDALSTDRDITYSVYSCNIKTNTPWIYTDEYTDAVNYGLISITESTTDIYDRNQEEVYFYRTQQL